ncbi:MAG: phenylalanine--tRNA ligase subunit alpha [Verrucomicrobia bacterium]|nr:phenylalanine--tRNA ligase subunit alpha [Verrucomicrobiota bacterium]
MKEGICSIQSQFDVDLKECQSAKSVEALKVHYLGRKGLVQDQLKNLRHVPDAEKPAAGKMVNDLKEYIEGRLDSALQECILREENSRLAQESIDITLPGRKNPIGSKHPITDILDEMVDIFVQMGFSVQSAPEVETEYYNFDVLNMGEDHPARDMQDTFYVAPGVVLRTHASNVQGRIMETTNPPIRVICPGRCFRNESISSRSHVFFHQIDGLYVDVDVSLQDLIATLTQFIRAFFKKEVDVKIRPSYFPFVEPGIEVDISCHLCDGKGCRLCKHSGWLEILGAGMVHPQVLRNVGLDPEKYSGYAWGLGIERMICLRHGIADIRLFAENDMRFLRQFPAP